MGKRRNIRQTVASAAQSLTEGSSLREIAEEGFALNPQDFLEAREQGSSVGTRIDQMESSLADAGEIVNRTFQERDSSGRFVHVISPVVIPKGRTGRLLLPLVALGVLGVIGLAAGNLPIEMTVLFGPHFWGILLLAALFLWWRRSVVMVPEGCKALITKFGKLVQIAEPGRVTLFNPWKRVGYIVNVTREYPFNAPIREAPTQQGVKASIDLFLQFRIEDPAEFIFVLGAAQGFAAKLQNAVSEVTRSLIYAQRAEDIYDLVGESTQDMLDTLNQQFLPAVRLTNVNITHAEPSSQEYRMDLAAPEMVRVAKEAYTYEYELNLKKEQDEGDLNKELAQLKETLSAIQAEIAGYQAQMDTALERESHKATAQARQRLVEAESTAEANAALLDAQALDIRALSSAEAPEILNYRFQKDILDKLEAVSERLPQVIQVGDSGGIDFLAIARQLVGTGETALFSETDMAAIRTRLAEISERVRDREAEIAELLTPPAGAALEISEERIEEIRASVADAPAADAGEGS